MNSRAGYRKGIKIMNGLTPASERVIALIVLVAGSLVLIVAPFAVMKADWLGTIILALCAVFAIVDSVKRLRKKSQAG